MGDRQHAGESQLASQSTPLRAALERLDQAIDRLEAAVEAREQRRSEGSDQAAQALDAALAREARSREEGKEIAGRLDGLINRLETVLGT